MLVREAQVSRSFFYTTAYYFYDLGVIPGNGGALDMVLRENYEPFA